MSDELYQEIILEHNKRPQNFRCLEHPTHSAEGDNPLCGDEITVFLEIQEGIVQDVGFQGQGCAISKASASLMTQAIKHKSLNDVKNLVQTICTMLTQECEPSTNTLDQLGDIAALSGVRKFHARIKCASLAWHTLEAAIHKAP